MENSNNRTLIVGPAWVGDMIMAQSLFKLMRRKKPDRDIDVLAPAATVPIVSRMPEVTAGIRFEPGHGELNWSYRQGLGVKLRERGYAQAIILPNSFKSALVPFFADIPVRTGFRGEFRYVLVNDMRMLSKRRLPRMVDRFVTLGVRNSEPLPEIDFPALMVDRDNLDNRCEELEVRLDRPVLGICPGAEFGDAKRWPERHYAALADYAVRRGMQVWIFGSSRDRGTGEEIHALVAADSRESCVDLTGKTSLLDAIDLLSVCNLVVSNDSGLMHVAAAVGRPVAVIYGSTSPEFTPPLSDRAEIISENLDCSPCFKRTCPLGHKNCLNQLSPARLESIVDRYAGEAPG